MSVRLLLAIAAMAAAARAGAQQDGTTETPRVITVDAPRRPAPAKLLRAAIAAPHDLLVADSSRRLVLPRSTTLPRTAIVIGGSVSVAASVRGDLIVIGGDLYLRPGASIDGRAVAIGGAVYGSTLARVAGGIRSFRDLTFVASNTPTALVLRYESLNAPQPTFELPVLDGLRIPLYDRVDGATVPWGPLFHPSSRVDVDPTIAYRSHLGAWDPGVYVLARTGEIWRLTLDARRSTYTNEGWIQSDLINSFNTLVAGSDHRNYYRADRVEVSVGRVDQTPTVEVQSYAGVLTERAWSVGNPDTLGARPWTMWGSSDPDRIARGNPRVAPGRISAGVAGVTARWRFGDVLANSVARLEIPWQTPTDARFAQITVDGTIQFPTFGVQRFRSDIHIVATPGDTAPPQRFAYLGGSGTLPVDRDPLSLGGDRLFFLDSRYEIPLPRFTLPYLGAPIVTLRHRVGSAGVQHLPRLTQNIGVTAAISFFRAEFYVDPATREHKFGISLSVAR